MWKKILKIALIILILGVIAGLAAWLVHYRKWPWWVGVALFVGFIGIWIGILFIKRYLQRGREKKFVERIVAQDDAAIKSAPIHERQRLQELEDNWKESIERLSSSNLRRWGNPLYALPWYVVIGESGFGKTSAIIKANANSPFTDISPAATLAATRNCDWWFFDEAIVLDTAGRYTIPIDEGPDREEWKKFLVLLAKYRRREPLNGVIVTISADKLLNLDKNELTEEGVHVRLRIDQLMRTTGAKFPVYLLVTKMDLVHGFVDFSRYISGGDLSQAMGAINDKMNPYWNEFLEHSLNGITEKLRELRFAMVNDGKPTPGALFFPTEFEGLKPGLETFSQALFEENIYQETPLFRGIYFSSARQQGSPQSQFLSATALMPSGDYKSTGEDGIFLQDLFKKVLPDDRYLYRPIREFLRWRVLTGSHGLLAWVLIWLSLCGLLSYSFIRNSLAIGNLTREFQAAPVPTDDMATNLLLLDKLRSNILNLEQGNRDWWLPRFGLHDSLTVEQKIKQSFTALFKDAALKRFDASLFQQVEKISPNTPDSEAALYASYMTNRIHLQQMALKKEKIVRVAQFDDACTRLISERYPQILPEIASRFDDLYYAYLLWNKDQNDCRLNSEESLLMMKRLLDRKGKSLEWLVEIPIADVPDIHLHDIWGAADENAQNLSVYVSRAYTAEGRKRITDFLVLMYKIGLNKEIGGEVSDKFWDWYWPTFFESWLEFTVSFDSGIDFLVEAFAKKYMLALMTTSQNPYFRLLDRMSDEFSRDVQKSRLPPWAALVLSLKEIRHTAKVEAEKAKGKLTGKLEDVTEKLVEKTREIGAEKNVKEYENRLEIAGVWKNYETALAQLLPATTSHEVCFNMVSDYFKQESGEKIPAFLNVHNEAFKLKSMMQEYGDAIAVWDIVLGPLNFLLDYGIMDAECTLQEKWEEQILGTIKSAGSDKVSDVLFNKSDGIVWKFVSGPAQPFVMKSKKGYIARKSHDLTIPFNSDFFDFLNVGERNIAVLRSDYVVTMETLPLTVNNGANIKPYGNVISLSCSDKEVSLENYNYPQSRIFHWKPDKCGGVIVRIFLPDLVLTKTYNGPMAFPSFLSEFGDGTRTFRADEFPDEKKHLSDMGISWIRLSYSISGKGEIVELLKSRAVQAPDEIVPCLLR